MDDQAGGQPDAPSGAVRDNALSVPWTARDVWIGVGVLVLWLALFVGVSLLVRALSLDVNLGVFLGLAEMALLVPVWWLVAHKYDAGWSALGLRGFETSVLGLGCGLMVVSFLFNALYGAFLALFDLRAQIDLVPIFAELSSAWWLLLAGVVVAPVVEEIFFRGFVFAGLAGRYDWRVAAAISSALFAVIHLQPLAVLPIFILGYIFAFLYQQSGSLWPAILMHLSTNALGLGAAYLAARMGIGA